MLSFFPPYMFHNYFSIHSLTFPVFFLMFPIFSFVDCSVGSEALRAAQPWLQQTYPADDRR